MVLLVAQRIVRLARGIVVRPPLAIQSDTAPDRQLDAAAIADHFPQVRRQLAVY